MILTIENRQIGILIDRLLEIVTHNDGKEKNVPQLLINRNAPRCRDMLERVIETEDKNKERTTTLIIDIPRFFDTFFPSSQPVVEVETDRDM